MGTSWFRTAAVLSLFAALTSTATGCAVEGSDGHDNATIGSALSALQEDETVDIKDPIAEEQLQEKAEIKDPIAEEQLVRGPLNRDIP